jgi:hypothetical protein
MKKKVADLDGINALLNYQNSSRQMPASELAKAIVDLNQQGKTPQVLMQKAILYANLHGPGDLARAQGLLDGVLKATELDAEHFKPLAALLITTYGDWRHMDDSADKLNQQLRDGQRHVDQLNEKLERLKNMEQLLPTRTGAANVAPQSVEKPGNSK